METIEKYTGIGGGDHTPKMLTIHAMAQNIKLDKDLKLKDKTIKAGVYPAHEWLQLLGLSCHFLQNPDGSFTKQRSTKKVCWHAKGFNTGNIGIEVLMEGTHNYGEFIELMKTDWVTRDQYGSLPIMSKGIMDFYDITNIKRHSDLSPERKYDPGEGFAWSWFLEQLK